MMDGLPGFLRRKNVQKNDDMKAVAIADKAIVVVNTDNVRYYYRIDHDKTIQDIIESYLII